MALISGSIPNLVNGISQQPFALRLSSQSEDELNTFPSVVEGLKKRPPSRHAAMLGNTPLAPGQAAIHTINRDPDERYIVVIQPDDLAVYDLHGQAYTVHFPHGKAYLRSARPETGFRAVTVADYTFIVNKDIATAALPDTVAAPPPTALLYVAQGNYLKDYAVYLNDQFICAYQPPDGSQAAHGAAIATDAIAYRLCHGAQPNDAGVFKGTPLAQLAGVQCTLRGSVITLHYNDAREFALTTTDGVAGRALRAFKHSVQRFSDLPANDVTDGFALAVVGERASGFDDYYVRYHANGSSAGVWKEALKPGEPFRIDPATMPHLLVREADGSFTFRPAEWVERKVGDATSAPWPSFIGRTIGDVFFYRNRLGFISDENVILSRAGAFFNFWPTTVTAVLDTDPVDVAVAHTKVSLLRHVVPFNEQLLLFSDQTQFVVKSADLLTPNTVAISQTTEFETASQCRPVGAGRHIYFAVNRGQWSGVRELSVSADADTNDAADITSHCPKLLPAGLVKIAAATNENVLVCLSAHQRNTLYLYKYYFADADKLQSAWTRWRFDAAARILNIDFIDSTLIVLVSRPSGTSIETIDLAMGHTDPEASGLVHLDRKCALAPTATTANETFGTVTFLQLPYRHSPQALAEGTELPWRAIVGAGQRVAEGKVLAVYAAKDAPDVAFVRGDYSGVTLLLGLPYRMRYEFSTIALREEALGGGQSTVGTGRLQLRNLLVNYANTGYFEAHVYPQGRGPFTTTFTGQVIGARASVIGQVSLHTGRLSVPVQCRNSAVRIVLQSDQHLPAAFMSAEWEGFYHARSQRLR